MLVGVVLAALAVAGSAQAGISRFVAGGTADSSYGSTRATCRRTDGSCSGCKTATASSRQIRTALDLYLRDRISGETEGIGVNEAGELVGANGGTISADGRLVAFSAGDGILASDANGLVDVFSCATARPAAPCWYRGRQTAAPRTGRWTGSADLRRRALHRLRVAGLKPVAGDSNDAKASVPVRRPGRHDDAEVGRPQQQPPGVGTRPCRSRPTATTSPSSRSRGMYAKLDTFGGQVFAYDRP